MYIGETPELGSPGEGISGKYPLEPSYIPKLTIGMDDRSRRFLEHGTPQDRGAIYVNPDPDPVKNSRLMRHESIHNLLDMAGVDIPGIHGTPSVKPYAEPLRRAADAHMGDRDVETPAYAGAYHEGDLEGTTPQQRMDYLKAFGAELARAKPKTASTFQRMVAPQMSYGRK